MFSTRLSVKYVKPSGLTGSVCAPNFWINTRQGEDVYDRHLREFLFREGFNMPYSQQRSPLGLSYVICDLQSNDPLICDPALSSLSITQLRQIQQIM